MRHPMFIARTVLVQGNDVEMGIRVINRILGKEGVIDDYRRIQRYEKPWQTRKRVNREHCKALYNEEMARKVNFLMRKNRKEAYPGCY